MIVKLIITAFILVIAIGCSKKNPENPITMKVKGEWFACNTKETYSVASAALLEKRQTDFDSHFNINGYPCIHLTNEEIIVPINGTLQDPYIQFSKMNQKYWISTNYVAKTN